nr:hypothetical protein [Actinomycetota bacterium]
MSAPTVERTWQTTPRARVPAQRASSAAIGRAYARRAGRQQRLADPTQDDAVGRPRFVLMVMALLGAGLVASLWLSTSAAADSYRLDQATHATRDLSERGETLRTEIAAMRSAPTLAQAARNLGMVPVSDVARLVARSDGSVVIVGTPKAGVAPAPVPPPLPDPGVAPSAAPGAVPG